MVVPQLEPFETDPSRWRLRVKEGRQTWHYVDENDLQKWPATTCDKYWLGTLRDDELQSFDKPTHASDAARIGFEFFRQLQTEDGHWAGEYGGPLFLIPGLVITCHVTKTPLPIECQKEIIRYLRNTVAEEGGWGLHIEGKSIVLCTATNYAVLRLLGVSANDPVCRNARRFLAAQGGTTGIPSWGKFWLSVLNVYEWDGMYPLLPELWLLPYWVPFHPGRMWCHCRQIYLPMSYCYAHWLKAEETELIRQLRTELYTDKYENVDWVAARNQVAKVDCYAPHHVLLDIANGAMGIFERFHSTALRRWSLKEVVNHIRADDRNTKCISIGPVSPTYAIGSFEYEQISKVINMLVMWHVDGPTSTSFKEHVERIPDYLWMANDGMRMQGTNGSQLWDTALAIYGLVEANLDKYPEFQENFQRAYAFLDDCQIKENTQDYEKYYRQVNKGAFPFSTRDCGWIVSDCTAEGLKAVMYLNRMPFINKTISDERVFQGIDVLLNMQNADGGFASYEFRRGPFWLEYMNPSEVFGEIMVDYSYTECSSAVTQVLSAFRKFYPDYRVEEINVCIDRAIDFVRAQQRPDGSWFGSWGVCFTYAMWFALEALACAGEYYDNSDMVRKACSFLESVQMEDGGWGESYLACTEKVYVQHEKSQVVMTAWACMALMACKYPHRAVLERGMRLLIHRQKLTGEWKQEAIEGVFNKTCMISYPNYKFIFPIWALGKFALHYGDPDLSTTVE